MNDVRRLQQLSLQDKAALADFVSRLRQQFKRGTIQSVWLFGSKIKGTGDDQSDIDLLIVVRNYTWKLEKAITRIAVDVDLAHDVVLSDHIVDSTRYDQMVVQSVLLYRNVMKEGIDLWQMELQPLT
jgi:predicted nucleotidyltransferase